MRIYSDLSSGATASILAILTFLLSLKFTLIIFWAVEECIDTGQIRKQCPFSGGVVIARAWDPETMLVITGFFVPPLIKERIAFEFLARKPNSLVIFPVSINAPVSLLPTAIDRERIRVLGCLRFDTQQPRSIKECEDGERNAHLISVAKANER